MWEFLRDPIWQFLGALIGALGIASAIALGLVVYRLQRRRKEIGYRVLSRARVASVEAQVAERVQVLFEGQLVRDVHLVVVQILNSGNEPIVADDYERPLRIHTGETCRILTAELAEHQPDTLPAPPTISEARDSIQIQPLLLNPGDWFNVTMLVSEPAGVVEVHGRIVGVKEIRHVPQRQTRGKMLALIALVALAYCLPVGLGVIALVRALSEGRGLVALGCAVLVAVWIPSWMSWAPRVLDRYAGSSSTPDGAAAGAGPQTR